MILLRDVHKSYPGLPVLEGFSLTVGAGRRVALIGSSGSGKSTVLRLLIGLTKPHAGTIEIDGQPFRTMDVRAHRLRTGYVIQGGGLFPHLNAFDNVSLVARTLRWPAARIDRRVHELADLVRLPSRFLDGFPGRLSGGQNQRVALMRALMLDPDILLLDEPLGALDPVIRADLQDDLTDIFQRLRKTVVFVTHNLPEAAAIADELVMLEGGRVVQQGTLDELVRKPASEGVARFIGAHRVPAALASGGA